MLVEDPSDDDRDHLLQMQLANLQGFSNPESYNTACLNVITELKESNLFLKQDIQASIACSWLQLRVKRAIYLRFTTRTC